MEVVQPIRDKRKIEEMKNELLKHGMRDYMLFFTGINTGLRITDILNLKVKDVKKQTHISLREEKTDKFKRFKINTSLKKELAKYTKTMDDEEYLFQSRKGDNKPITRIQAYRILTDAAKVVGLEEIGCHTMRKTFGYHFYKKYKDIALLQNIFNHSYPAETMIYIGINQDNMDEAMDDFDL